MSETTESTDRLACPDCGSTDRLGTLEQLEAVSPCYCVVMEGGYPTPEFTGETDYSSDMETIGIVCRSCGWESPNIEDLVPA